MKNTKRIFHLIVALLLLPALPAIAADIDCQQMLSATAAKKLDKPVIVKAQQSLATQGYDPGEIDGFLGPNTRSALLRFCTVEQYARAPDLLTMLREHEIIFRAHQDWLRILGSNNFQQWAGKQTDAAQIEQTRQSGNAASVIALLNRYDKRTPANNSTAKLKNDGASPISYFLTKDDFAQLKTREVLAVRVGKLLDKAYGDEDEFEKSAKEVLKDSGDTDEYLRLAKKSGAQQAGNTLSDASFADLKTADIPDYVLDALQKIKDLNYTGNDLDTTVASTLGALSAETMGFKTELVKLAEVTPTGGSLTDSSLAKFAGAHQDDLLAAAVADQLAQLKGLKYKDDNALASALQKTLADIAAQIDGYAPVILEAAEQSSTYMIDKEQAQVIPKMIKDSVVPEIFLSLIAGLQDVDYPDADLFWLATKSRIELAAPKDPLRKSIWDAIEQNNATKVDPALMQKFKDAKLPPPVLDKLEGLQGKEFANSKKLEDEITGMFKQLSIEYDHYHVLILAQARKRHLFDPAQRIQWSGNGCNCVNNALYGAVYGMYPYWMAGHKQAVNFSVQSRIGYYGLTFDDQGAIVEPARWSGIDTDFIREARKYSTKVDLVIYKKDWKGWPQVSDDSKTVLLKKLAANIAALVKIPMTDPLSKIKPVVSLGGARPSIMGDGVTLHFEDYPTDVASVNAFKTFILALREELSSQGRGFAINIVFRSEELGKGVYDYQNLLDLKSTIENSGEKQGSGLKLMFLLLLQEPTAVDEKKVRRFIEQGLSGEKLVKLLRSIVTVVTYDGRSESQLADDVIYAKDNFGGIGFWTLPVAGTEKAPPGPAAAVNKILSDRYVNGAENDTPAQAAVCGIVCPNRWTFRISWDFLVVVVLVSMVLYVTTCECRSFFATYFVQFLVGVIAPFLLLTFTLLFCDPSWRLISRGNGLLILLTVAVLAYIIWSYLEKKRSMDLP